MTEEKSLARVFMTLTVLLAVLGAGIIGWLLGTQRPRIALAQLGRAPDYRLVNQLSRPVSSDQFKGKIQVATFLFPYCTTYCPLIASHLVGFENTLARAGLQDKVEIVAFDVDPSGTGPKQMRAFMREYGWNPHNLHWQYLTGKPREIRRVVTNGFHVAYQRISDNRPPDAADSDAADALTPQPTVVNHLAETARPGYDIIHNDGMEIVDGKDHVRKVYENADMVTDSQLLRVVRELLATTRAS